MLDRMNVRLEKMEALRVDIIDQQVRAELRIKYLSEELLPVFEKDVKKNEKHKAKDPSDAKRAQYDYSLNELDNIQREINESAKNIKAYGFYLDYLEQMIEDARVYMEKVN